jgi:MtN3 and saliva related transmembrane protein
LIKIWTSCSADAISPNMTLVLATGLALWIVFGILRDEIPIIVANARSLALRSRSSA